MATAARYDNLLPLSAGRIPSLDGLRAVAVSLVILAHLRGLHALPGRELILEHGGRMLLAHAGDLGNLGVRIFFVISGFLITSLLLAERASTGRISLKNFYLRRVIRIFPAAYAYIAVIGILGLCGLLFFSRTDFLAACTYTINCFPPVSGPTLAHLWSLAVEEQFYLLWPLALCLAGKKRNGVFVAAVFFLIGPCARYVYLNWAGHCELVALRSFATNADALASGCLLAGLRETLGQIKLYRILRRSWLFLVALFLVAAHRGWGLKLGLPIDVALLNISIALGIDWCVSNHDGLIGRVLNWRPLAFVGVLSYSLYLWQQLFLTRESVYPLNVFPLNLLLIFVLALLSYYGIEKPFLNLRKRFSARKPPAVDTPPAAPL